MKAILRRGFGMVRDRRLPDLGFWLSNSDLLWRELFPSRAGAWHVVHPDPPIVYVMPFSREEEAIARQLRHRDAWLLVSNPWVPRSRAEAGDLRKRTDDRRRRYPRLSVVYLCNDAGETHRLSEAGLDAVFCHQNAFLDEDLFCVLNDVPVTHDAIYIAQLIAYKRHFLAREIPRLMVKTYKSEWCRDEAYIAASLEALSHADWIYQATEAEVCRAINRCRVGLCLSAVEGAMYGSMEYLLCGRPIVTTPNIGGRDVFFDEEYVRWVDPDPHAVRDAVATLIARRLDPHAIRRATLKKLEPHRRTFADTINRILVACGRRPTFVWGDAFTHKMYRVQRFRAIHRQVGAV